MSIDSESFSLDLSWIDEEEKLLQYQSFIGLSPLESIQICCVFLDGSGGILRTEKGVRALQIDYENSLSVLSRENVGEILSGYGCRGGCGCGGGEAGVNMVVEDILLFNVDITTEQLQNGVDLMGMGHKFLKSFGACVGDIIIPQSLSIFHCIQSLYFFVKPVVLQRLPKSILKKNEVSGSKYRSTKRVRIHPDTFKKAVAKHKTRRVLV